VAPVVVLMNIGMPVAATIYKKSDTSIRNLEIMSQPLAYNRKGIVAMRKCGLVS